MGEVVVTAELSIVYRMVAPGVEVLRDTPRLPMYVPLEGDMIGAVTFPETIFTTVVFIEGHKSQEVLVPCWVPMTLQSLNWYVYVPLTRPVRTALPVGAEPATDRQAPDSYLSRISA